MTFSKQKMLLLAGVLLLSTLAQAEIAVVMSAKTARVTLTQDQVADIFLGRRHRLPNGDRITPVDQAEGEALRHAFYLKLVDKSPSQVKAHWSKLIFTGRGRPPKEVSDSEAVKRAVSAGQGRIGYIDSDALDASVKVVLILP